jgi:hypothetical protein
MKRRAIFFTLDSLLAMILVGILSVLIFSSMSSLKQAAFSDGTLVLLSESLLASLQSDGTLARAVSNSTAIGSSLSLAPPSLCWEINLDREDGTRLASERRALCQCDEGRSVFSRRALVVNNGTGVSSRMIATGRFCFK